MTFRSSTINSAFNQSINQSPPARVGNSCKPPSRLFPRRLPRRPVVSERGPSCGLHGGAHGVGGRPGRRGPKGGEATAAFINCGASFDVWQHQGGRNEKGERGGPARVAAMAQSKA